MPKGKPGTHRPRLQQAMGAAMTPQDFARLREVWGCADRGKPYTQEEFGLFLVYNTQSINDMACGRRAIVARTVAHIADLERLRQVPRLWAEVVRTRLAPLRDAERAAYSS